MSVEERIKEIINDNLVIQNKNLNLHYEIEIHNESIKYLSENINKLNKNIEYQKKLIDFENDKYNYSKDEDYNNTKNEIENINRMILEYQIAIKSNDHTICEKKDEIMKLYDNLEYNKMIILKNKEIIDEYKGNSKKIDFNYI